MKKLVLGAVVLSFLFVLGCAGEDELRGESCLGNTLFDEDNMVLENCADDETCCCSCSPNYCHCH